MKRSLLVAVALCAWFVTSPRVRAEVPASAPATTQSGKAFLWTLKTADGKPAGAIAGSVHLATPDFYPLPDAFDDQFDKASKLVVEVDITKINPLEMQNAIMQMGMYTPPDELKNHVSKETMDALNNYGKLPAIIVGQMKPWLAATFVTLTEVQAMGFEEELGIDMHFLKLAHEKNKPIGELETAMEQFKILSGFDDKTQETFLASTLADLGELKASMNRVATAWQSGNAQMIDNELVERGIEKHPETKPVVEKLLFDRNKTMAEKIDTMIKAGDTPFVVVGAGHLVGDKGLVKLLSDKGYTLEQASGQRSPATKPTSSPATSGAVIEAQTALPAGAP